MHVPDGFLSPQTWIPAWGLAIGAWAWAARDLRRHLDEATVPRLAMLTALAYGLGLVMVPLPGGSSGHVLGVALLTLLFGLKPAFLAYSGVLLLQALLFGAGGITTLGINALALGLAGGVVALLLFRLLRPIHEGTAVALAAWGSVMTGALLLALVLGAQPLLASQADGSPLFFPFGWSITLPALLIPHLFIGLGEAALTLLVWRHARQRGWRLPSP
ncbi:MAG: energy-coupling factor ABC transporter permease [Azovibrio sp.]|uniref:energy-coupling factor ABC transporter permease n=1 Tax=Azovibrio sp. TaxID=1872673 RepID=UPI003C70C974